MQIKEGELIAVIGASGSGKSTLLKIIGLLDTYEQGTYVLGNQAVEKLNERGKAKLRNQKIGFIMQDFALLEDRSALANVMTPLLFDRQYTLGQAKQKSNGGHADDAYGRICKAKSFSVIWRTETTDRDLSGHRQ